MKKFYVVLTTLLLAISIKSIAQSDFTVTSPSTDSYGGLIKPMKAGSNIQIQIKMKNNKNVTYTASINKSAMYPYDGWVQIDNNSQTLAYNQTITFLLTITPPLGTPDDKYSLFVAFNAYDSNNKNNPYTWSTLKILVDNTPPLTPSVSISYKTSSSISIGFTSFDERSNEYTNVNQSSGINGIKSYSIVLRNPDGTIKESKSGNATDMSSYTFSNLTPYTNYTTSVLAADLAGNTNASSAVPVKTLMAAPTSLASNATYCSITLTWSASAGATGYKVYTASGTLITPNPISATSFTITGLSAGSTNSYYVKAVNGAETSANSIIVSTSTLPIPTPSFSASDLSMCSNDKTFEINAVPNTDSYTWTVSSPLTINGGQTYTTTSNSIIVHSAVVQGQATISVVANLACGIPSNTITKSFLLGIPTPSIDAELISESGEPTTVQFTTTNYNNTTYSWYVNGILQEDEIYNVFQYYFPCRVTKTITCKLTNTCGTSDLSNSSSPTGECTRIPEYSVSPNPASSTITISTISTNATSDSPQTTNITFDFVRIFDLQGNLKKSLRFQRTNSSSINVGGLQNGSYIIEIGNAEFTEKHQILIKK